MATPLHSVTGTYFAGKEVFSMVSDYTCEEWESQCLLEYRSALRNA